MLGLNGAGKSTLLKIMAGLDDDFYGEAWAAEGASVGFLPQEPELDPAKDVAGNVMEGMAETKALLDRFEEVSARFAEDLDARGDGRPDRRAGRAAGEDRRGRRLGPGAHGRDRHGRPALPAGRCRGEQALRRRAAPGRALPGCCCRSRTCCCWTSRPTTWTPSRWPGWSGTCRTIRAPWWRSPTTATSWINVAGWILELDRGQGIPFEGNYSGWLEQKQKRLAQQGKAEAARQRTLSRELEWIQQSPRARQAKSKARLSAYEKLLAEGGAAAPEPGRIVIPPGPRLGDLVIEAEGLSKGFDDKLLIEGLDFQLPPAGIVGIIGANGAGKTTLFRMLVGQEQPDAGSLKVGETVTLGYVDQSRDSLAADKTVWEEISDGLEQIELGKKTTPSRAYVGAFNFRGADQQKKVGQLSGGERNRVHLAKMLKSGANVLLLDEPTNDLDVDTLRALEGALDDFAGCALIISHDRWFLDRVATHILAFEGDSQVVWFQGNYEDYEADRRRRLGDEADRPHRIKYKPLTR